MNILKPFLFILFFSSYSCQITKETSTTPENPKLILAFGSCSKENKEQKLWDDIIKEQPDVWIWLGDNVYGDTEDMTVLRGKYNQQKKHPLYQQLLAQTTILGTWDDHDYGANDAGKDYNKKEESQQELLNFLDVPLNDPRRKRKGVYHAQTIEKEGLKVQIILLDARYFRDDLIKKGKVNQPNVNGEILGEEQWQWLESVLKNSTADVHILGSGIQVIPEEHRFEKWANYPTERKRLFDLLTTLNVKRPIFISGDRHSGEISKLEWLGKTMYDITSSSLTHSRPNSNFEPNQYRVGEMVYTLNYGVLEITKNPAIKIQVFLKGNNQKIEQETLVIHE